MSASDDEANSKKEIAGPSEAGPSGAGTSGGGQPPVVGQGIVVDASVLANIINQARGPILDRISRQLAPFTGDGAVEVSDWLATYQRLCEVERLAPTDLLTYMLSGNAARVYNSMRVGDASQWEVVRAVLTAEYAMPRQEAWRRFINCELEGGESVDVYLSHLERLGGESGLRPE